MVGRNNNFMKKIDTFGKTPKFLLKLILLIVLSDIYNMISDIKFDS